MGNDAVRDLRDWQRRQMGAQDRALRAAAKAHARLARLDEQRTDAADVLADAIEVLASTGISRDQAAAFLGVTPSQLGRRPVAITRRAPDSDSDKGGEAGPVESTGPGQSR